MTDITEYLESERATLLGNNLSRVSTLIHKGDGTPRMLKIIDEDPNFVYKHLINKDKPFNIVPMPEPNLKNLNKSVTEEEKINLKEAGFIEIDEETSKCTWIRSTDTDDESDEQDNEIKIARWAKALGINTDYEVPKTEMAELGGAQTDKNLQTFLYEKDLILKLRSLNQKTRSDDAELGIKSLYLALGFLEWYDDKNRKCQSPLVLLPVSIDIDRYSKCSIQYNGDDVESNKALLLRMEREGIELPEFDTSDPDEVDIEQYFEKINEAIDEKDDWCIRRYISMSDYNLTELEFYEDLNPENWDAGVLEANEFLMQATREGDVEQPDREHRGECNIEESDLLEKRLDLVFEADPSQYLTIKEAANKKDLVVSGPPGTGKSQTIANMIGQFISQGNTVLFVSQKKVALDVVRRNLDSKNLGQLCFELLSAKSNRGKIIGDLKNRYNLYNQPTIDHEEIEQAIDDNVNHRYALVDSLNAHAILMSEKFADSNITTFDILTTAGSLRKQLGELGANITLLNHLGRGFEFTRKLYRDQKDQMSQYQLLLNKVKDFGTIQENPWYGFQNYTVMRHDYDSLFQDLKDYQASISDLIERCEEFQAITDADEIVELDALDKHKEFVDQFKAINIQTLGEKISKIFAEVSYEDLSNALNQYDPLYKSLNYKVSEVLPGWQTIDSKIFDELSKSLDSIPALSEKIKKYERDELKQQIEEYQEVINHFFLSYEEIIKIANRLEIEDISSFQSFRSLNTIQQFLENHKEFVPEIRDEKFHNEQLDDYLVALDDKVKLFKTEEKMLRPYLNTDIINFTEMKPHFRALNAKGIFQKFSEEYIQARKYLKEITSTSAEQNNTSRLKHFMTYYHLLEDREEFDRDIEGVNLLGKHFKGHETNVSELKQVRKFYKEVRQNFTGTNQKFGTKIINLPLGEFLEIANSVDAELSNKSIALYEKTKDFYILSKLPVDQQQEFFSKKSLTELKTAMNDVAKVLDEFIPTVTLNSLIDTVVGQLPKLVLCKKNIETILDNSLLDLTLDDHKDQLDNLITAIKLFDTAKQLELDTIEEVLSEGRSDEIQRLLNVLVELGEKFQDFQSKQSAFYASGTIQASEWQQTIPAGVSFSLVEENSKCLRAIQHSEHLSDWIQYQKIGLQLNETPSIQLKDLIEDGSIRSEDLLIIYEYIYYQNLSMRLLDNNDQLRDFNGPIQEQKRSSFQRLDREYIGLIPERVLARANNAEIPYGATHRYKKQFTELQYLKHEFGKQRGFFPPRTMVRQALGSIQALKPCFMMRPTEVARYLPKEVLFDVVIMDESSQILPEHAYGSLLRAKQYILVGDTKQLPPTGFFKARIASDGDGAFADDSESILEYAEKIVPIQNQEYLQWHYRSQHHSLINFSNFYFYDSNLRIFRSPRGQSEEFGVTNKYIENGTYSSRINEREAEAIVEEVSEHMRHHRGETLMVVTMNVDQKEEIDRQFQIAREQPENGHIKMYIDDRKQEPSQEIFDVKNLESVQGDERDVVFISYTYGPDPDSTTRKVKQSFRNISKENGWRRLNVLFTRARKRVRVFHSIMTSDIVPENSQGVRSRGKVAFRDYLEFAETGNIQGIMNVRGEPDNEFEESIGSALIQLGYKIDYQVGFSGFWIDMAVRDPNDEGRYILGIEADGASYHSHPSTRARDRLRQEILEGKGWEMIRVWSTDWFQDPDSEIQKIKTRIESLLSEQEESQAEEQMRVSVDVIDGVYDEAESEHAMRSRVQTMDMLIDLRENEIRPRFPENFNEEGILRTELLSALIKFLPTTRQEFSNMIPLEIRDVTKTEQTAEYLDRILEILADCDPN